MMPDSWMVPARWDVVSEFLRWLPVPWQDRKQALLLWADRAGVKLTRYHYESIARPGEVGTDAGTD